MSLHRLRDCFLYGVCVAMEKRLKVAIVRKSIKFALFMRTLQCCPWFQLLITRLPRIAILHDIWRVCLFKCNARNVKTIDTERTCLTSQIFAVVDFAKHRPGMRRLHLRHCGNLLQYSHGSIATPSTPQLEQVSVTSWRLDDISETIEQKWWQRVKLTSGITP